MKKTPLVVSLIGAFLAGMLALALLRTEADHPSDTSAAPQAASEFTCSMHPQIRLPEMGQCPICFMDLIAVTQGGQDENERLLVMSEAAMNLADIRTVAVRREDRQKSIRLQSRVAYDETRVRQISAWLPGRIDRKYVDYTGIVVQEGEHLVEIYSPELVDAQENLLQALNGLERGSHSKLPIIRDVSRETYQDAREKLLLLGLQENQVRNLERTRTFSDRVTIYSPNSGIVIEKHIKQGAYVQTGSPLYTIADLESVWLIADVYQSEINWLRYGQEVTFTVHSFPGETFQGRVSFISPTVDNASRTIKIRINVENPGLRLKPGMFATAWVQARLSERGLVLDQNLEGLYICPMHHELVKDGPGLCDICGMELEPSESLGLSTGATESDAPLLIPRSAPLLTGTRAIVYVRIPGEKVTFEYREIILGPKAGDMYVVRSGLEEGEEVVYQGAFKIDASRQILARQSMMSLEPEEGKGFQSDDPKLLDEMTEFMGLLQEAYYLIQTALAEDRSAKSETAKMATLLESAPIAGFAPADRKHWLKLIQPLTAAFKTYAEAADIEVEREVFDPLSNALIELIDYFGAAATTYQFHCPMGPGEDGSSWLQSGSDMFNPYMGSRMLKCGSLVTEIRGRQ